MEIKAVLDSFMSKLIDWKDFEKFVTEMYQSAENVIAEHNVTEIGKSGAKRQVDVLVTITTKLHKIKVLIECKKWKSKVDRPVIDVMAAAIEDLAADKGVIFTTVGFEEGAVQYANSKNIELFLIRDVNEDEWGNPGRHILLYLQLFSASMTNFTFANTKFIVIGDGPRPTNLSFGIHVRKEMIADEQFQLYDADGKKGANLMQVLVDIQTQLLTQLYDKFDGLMQPADAEPQMASSTPVELDMTKIPHRFLKREGGMVVFDTIQFDVLRVVSQSKIEMDRAGTAEFVLMVENYISKQRNFVSKSKEDQKVTISDIVTSPEKVPDDKELFKNGMVAKIITEYYISPTINPGTNVQRCEKVLVNLNIVPPDQTQA